MSDKRRPEPAVRPPGKDDVAHIETWIFDLDNTLYPADCQLFVQVDHRIGRFIADRFGLVFDEARGLQKHLFREHGTTLRGLMDHHDIDPQEFLQFVHDIDFSPVPPDPALVEAVGALPGKKLVFTNGDRPYAEQILDRLGFSGEIDGIFGIVEADYIPKPRREPYEKLTAAFGLAPDRALLVEDIARNLKPAHDMGMTTVWLPTGAPWSHEGAESDYVQYVIADLAGWLADLAGTRRGS